MLELSPASPPTTPQDLLPTVQADGYEDAGLPPELFHGALRLRDWLLTVGIGEDAPNILLSGLSQQLIDLGIPVDRTTTAIDTLHSEYSGIGRMWTKRDGSSFRLFPHGRESDDVYARSPFKVVHDTKEWLLIDLAATPDDRFGIVPELKADGYRHYLVVPLIFTNGTANGLTFATSSPEGFTARHLAVLRFIMPTLAAAMEIRAIKQRLDNVLRIYVGDEPHRAILSGAIRRGQISQIRSAILFADMRSYTRITSELSPQAAVQMLNDFFDCLVPPIEAEGGEVLKYMGDGLLAIFRDRGDDTGGTAAAALAAAIDALVKLDTANREGRFGTVRISAGIALHHGEAAYGNVGSGVRLDFTVIGRDVNLASRIATLNKILDEPLLMSRAFADQLWGDPERLGEYRLEGFRDPVPVYRLRAGEKDGRRTEGRAALPLDDLAFSG